MPDFEWDENKNESNKANQKKHDISFEDAKEVFYDENRRVYAPADLVGVNWTGGQFAYRNAKFQLTETTYVATKRAALALLADEPWFGVGPDRMEVLAGSKVATGDYPANLPHFRPHSTWCGALAETGWLGFLALSWLVIAIVRRAVRYFKSSPPSADERVLIAFLLLILGASLIVETLHLRYVWVPVGMLLGVVLLRKDECCN